MVALTLAALVLAACPDDAGVEEPADETPAPEAQGEITIGWIPWDEAIAVTNLWQVILEDQGYDVNQQQLEAGLLYSGVADGDLDLFLDAWLPATHEDYWERFGDDVIDLGAWFDQAPLTWAVPAYLEDINSIGDLQGNADMFDGQIVGIEPGAGLTRISREEVVPTYELEGEYELVESSTPTMLSELETALDAEEPIVVTLWEPHWAYGAYELKNLEDPENALGDPDSIHAIARSDLDDDAPDVVRWLENFELTADQIAELSVYVLHDHDDELEGARAWYEENRDVVDSWLN